jgi:hypothetical protein
MSFCAKGGVLLVIIEARGGITLASTLRLE